ncbi:MAG TPA: beta-eliminating lyase-related protein [Casimicrobiaceae bacterium]|nr:beta-eliminating lyase-related protein [Casimicrobiaceae bacterium]
MIPAPLNAAEQESLRRRCTIHVSGHAPPAPGAELARIGHWCQEHGWHADRYGEGELIEGFERKVATLLGKAAAVFMPSGTMAQLIALRIWCERKGIRRIAMHATSHLELHEERAYAHLHGLDATLLGARERPTEARDLAALLAKSVADRTEQPAALLVELPAREIGGRLPAWEEIEALSALAHDHGMRLHMDGARLWEAREYFAPRSLADLCAPFDSVYVSFYKGIGALAGAMLLGPEDFIAEARIWRRRQGGTLVQLHPFVASAAMRLDMQLAKMPAYRARALGFAAGLSTIDGIVVDPQPPQVNLFHVHFAAPPAALTAARDQIASEDGAWLAQRFGPGSTAASSSIEIYVGDNLLAHDNSTVIPLFAKLLELAHSQARAASSLAHSNMLAAT